MTKFNIEICIISARGLRGSSFLKPQWFAVGWINPNKKYCTKIDTSGSANPTWKTRFSVVIDDSPSSELQALSLTVEVYKRELIFLREKFQGAAVVPLKEFLVKFLSDPEPSRTVIEECGSFQLRKGKSGKPQGFIEISIHISEKVDNFTSYPGMNERVSYLDHKDGITLAIEDGPVLAFPTQHQYSSDQFGIYNQNQQNYGPQRTQAPANYYPKSSFPGTGYNRPPTPPPPPPPSNTGFLPSLFPGTAQPVPQSYVSVPPSRQSGQSNGTAVAMGLGAGALAAGAVIFGDDFMSVSSNFASELDSGSLIVSTDTPF